MNNISVPIIVDLDGSLVRIDTFHEALIQFIRKSPHNILLVFFWLIKGKSYLKEKIAEHTTISPQNLPYNQELLAWLKREKSKGREVILCTGANRKTAKDIANHLKIFNGVHASDRHTNLTGLNKRKLLDCVYGKNNYDYVGNSSIDNIVWEGARIKIKIVNNFSAILTANNKINQNNINKNYMIIKSNNNIFINIFLSLRIHQWVKNLLIFVPIFTAHKYDFTTSIIPSIIAFCSFSLCASGIYVLNDIQDVELDRHHLYKKNRPFANGNLPISLGLFIGPVIIALGLLVSTFVNNTYIYWLLVYILISSAYSLYLKKIIIADCIVLAVLYTIRIIAGASAINVPVSFWLLTFSIFIFLSLAYVKRFTEINQLKNMQNQFILGRGYEYNDRHIVSILGIASGYASTIILSLYINSETVIELYNNPSYLWLSILIILYWISWIWSQAFKNKLHSDPILYAISDRVSIISALILGFIFVLSQLNIA